MKWVVLFVLVAALLSFFGFTGYRYYRASQAQTEKVVIEVSKKKWEKQEALRKKIVESKQITSKDKKYIPGKLTVNGETVKVKMRLKGDKLDHYTPYPPSLRVKVKGGDTIFGTNKLSIQDYTCRKFYKEWVFHKLLAREDIISLKMDIIDLTVYDAQIITTYEEHFTHYLTDRFSRPRSMIVCVSEKELWDQYGGHASGQQERKLYLNADIKVLQADKKLDSLELAKGIALLDDYRKARKDVHEVFDIDRLAKFYAVSDLCNATHGIRWHNNRYYLHPKTNKLEPIGFDASCGSQKKTFVYNDSYVKMFTKKVFYHEQFVELYLKYLEQFSSEAYLDKFFGDVASELNAFNNKVYDRDLFSMDGIEFVYENAEWIRNNLKEYKTQLELRVLIKKLLSKPFQLWH